MPKRTRSKLHWWAAHVILYFEEGRRQSQFLVWENVYLLRAKDASDAAKRGEELGRADCVPDETRTVGGRPAALVFGGVRRVAWCAAPPYRAEPTALLRDGTEATFSTFVAKTRRDLKALIGGRPVVVAYEG